MLELGLQRGLPHTSTRQDGNHGSSYLRSGV